MAYYPAMGIQQVDARAYGVGQREKQANALYGIEKEGLELGNKEKQLAIKAKMDDRSRAELREWARLLSNVRDPQSYADAMSMGIRVGLDPGPLGDIKYDPALVKGIVDFASIDEKPESFTLSPGQTRFRGNQPIASLEAKPEMTPEEKLQYEEDLARRRARVGREFAKPEMTLDQEVERARLLEEAKARGRTKGTPVKPSDKTAVNFETPDGEIVTSYDGGRTYLHPETRQEIPMPGGAIRIGTETGAEYARSKRLFEANKSGDVPQTESPPRPNMTAAAAKGTGPWSNLKSAFNAVAGGVGLDEAFGKEGFFPENEDNRQWLLILKQTGKYALMNSSRGAIWEQQVIEKLFPNPDNFWTNPRTEASKLPKLRDTLLMEKEINDRMLSQRILNPTETAKVIASNIDIERTLGMIGDVGRPGQNQVYEYDAQGNPTQ